MDLLPSRNEFKEASSVVAGQEALKLEAVYEFGDPECQSLLNIAYEWCKVVACSRSPQFKTVKEGSIFADIKDRLQYFLRATRPATGDEEAATEFIGKAALLYKFGEAQKLVAAKQAVNSEDLKVFDTYNWLLDGPQKDAHAQWVKLVFDVAGAGSSAYTSPALADNTSGMCLFKKRRVT